MTNGEFVSLFINDTKTLTKDTHISRRFILEKGRSIVSTYLAQRLDSMDISLQYDIVSTIECIEMEPVEGIKCGVVDLVSCNNIMKSKNKLPKILNGRMGVAVISVTNLDGSYVFKPTSTLAFKNKLKNKYTRDKEAYFIIQDGYLLLPNSEVEYVRAEVITLYKEDVKDCDCNETENDGECNTVWDDVFVCPENILTMVIDKVRQELAQVNIQVQQDENPNLDANQRGNAIQ